MVKGKLEVLLVCAKGLENTDFLNKSDPYAVLTCRSKEQRSTTASGAGSNPEWNESFVFIVSDNVAELTIKLMDHDAFSNDDFLGEAKIPLEAVFTEGSIPPTSYNVVKEQEYRGEVRVALTFAPMDDYQEDGSKETYGGWKESDSSY